MYLQKSPGNIKGNQGDFIITPAASQNRIYTHTIKSGAKVMSLSLTCSNNFFKSL